MAALGRSLLVVTLLGLSACAEPARRDAGPPLGGRSSAAAFVYTTTTGEELSSRTTRGRATAIVFVTTYDLASQLLVRRLEQVVRSQKPRVNAAAIVLEPPKYAVMAEAFRTALELSFPVAMADQGIGESGPFGVIDRVPTLIVLDRDGSETTRRAGVVSEGELRQALAAASERGFALDP